MTITGTYWNGEPALVYRGTAVVADAPQFPLYWARTEGIVGQRIPVVMVHYASRTFFLDDREGIGWTKVTVARGGPHHGHNDVEIEAGSFVPRPTGVDLVTTRHALVAADSILSLLTYRGLVDSHRNREDVRKAQELVRSALEQFPDVTKETPS
jgi:hypothetical protein